MRKLFLTWQDSKSRKWYPIGQLTWDGEVYRFLYISGALSAHNEAGFRPPVSFLNFHEIYESSELFPMFANRVMPASRPEYKQTIEWLALPESANDPLAFIARSGGAKVNDKFELFCYPELDDNSDYNLHFFAHGLRYLPKGSIERIEQMQRGEKIQIALDFQNSFETNALQLHTPDNHIVGYCPSYLLDDMNEYVRQGKHIGAYVERVNNGNAPLQFRLLCRLVMPQMSGFQPFSDHDYQPIAAETEKPLAPVGKAVA